MSIITLYNPVVSLTPSTSGNNWPADPDHQDMTGMHYAIFSVYYCQCLKGF